MSESQTEMRAIKQNLRLYQVNSHQVNPHPVNSQPQNLAIRSIHPFSEWLSEQGIDVPQGDRALSKTVLTAPARQSQVDQSPQANQSQAQQSQAQQSQTKQLQVDLPQINLPPISIPSPPTSPALPPPQTSKADRLETDVDWEPVRPVTQTHVNTDRLQQKSVQYLQQFVQLTPDRSNAQIDEDLKRLEAQALHINQISMTQETAILELKAIAQQIERDWKTLEVVNAAQGGYDASNIEIPAVCKYSQISLPLVEKNQAGVLVVRERSVDLFKAEREAALTAQSLRFRTAPSFKPRSSWTQGFRELLLGKRKTVSSPDRLASNGTSSLGDSRAAVQARAQKRKARSLSFREGISLLFGAVLVRVILNLLLSAHPAFRFSAIALMVTPGAIAVYRSRVTPKLTLTWGCRLVIIMIGFLIGGLL